LIVADSSGAIVYPNVHLGAGARAEPFAILGVPPRGRREGELPLVVGADAVIRSHAVIYAGNRIGERFHLGHGALVREENEIGDDVSVGSHSIVEHHVTLGNGVRIHSGAFVPEFSRLDDGAWLGPHAVLTNAPYPLGRGAKQTLRGPHLRRGAKVGANATILPGRVIGENALVGAGSVVVEDVPDGAVVAGNPARVIRMVAELGAYRQEADT
jgi:acetyltransferase-like isoleucine patch superfamily enzyme